MPPVDNGGSGRNKEADTWFRLLDLSLALTVAMVSEEQVAGLGQVTALGRHGLVVAQRHPVALLAQQLLHARQHDVGRVVGDLRRVLRQSREVARCPRGPGSQRPPIDDESRDDAPDERNHQQDVDRSEPRRGVDRDEVEPVPDRR